MSDITQIATNLNRLQSVIARITEATLQENFGFGTSQFKIVWVLHTHQEGVLQTAIAKWLNQTEAAISRQVGLLKDQGLISQEVDPNNRRNHIIMLSHEGREFADNAMKTLTVAYKPYFGGLNAHERDTLNTLLEKTFFSVVGKMQSGSTK
jgi:DNA-binding MarR family transcriptional regulator